MKKIILVPGGTLEQRKKNIQGPVVVTRSNGKQEFVGMDVRLAAAAQMYSHDPQNTTIVVAGRRQASFESYKENHSAVLAKNRLSKRFDVSKNNVVALDSCNGATYGDMQTMVLYLEKYYSQRSDVDVTLLTSQFHLPRAYAMFVDASNKGNGTFLSDYVLQSERDVMIARLWQEYSAPPHGDRDFVNEVLQSAYREHKSPGADVLVSSAEEVLCLSQNQALQAYGRKSLQYFHDANVRQKEYQGIQHLLEGTYNVSIGPWHLTIL